MNEGDMKYFRLVRGGAKPGYRPTFFFLFLFGRPIPQKKIPLPATVIFLLVKVMPVPPRGYCPTLDGGKKAKDFF